MVKVYDIAGVSQFDLDPCADHLSQWGKANYVLLRDGLGDGLALPWYGRVFVNPPWSDIGPWVAKAWDSFKPDSRVRSVTMLLPDNRQGTKWWQKMIEPHRDGRHAPWLLLTTRYLAGRPRYGSPDDPQGLRAKSPPFGAVVLHWARR